ncbi:hypothetical protein LG3211_0562 [Lysobacter gummosus]|nr:hypothetical protein LG3211_0562 [Lysobacter gummosus]
MTGHRSGYLDGQSPQANPADGAGAWAGSRVWGETSGRSSQGVSPARRVLLCFGGAEYPEASARSSEVVIPAKAGIQSLQRHPSRPSFP